MDSSKRSTEARRANVIYFLDRHGRIEHPHLIRVHHFCNSGVHLRDVKRWISELRGKDMPHSFSWSYQRRYKKGLVWQDLMDDDLLTPISDCEYVLLGSLLPGAESKSDFFTSPEVKAAPENKDLDVKDAVLPDEDGKEADESSSPAGKAGGRSNPKRTSHLFRSFITCRAVETVDSAVLEASDAGGVYGGLTKTPGSTRSPLRIQSSQSDSNKRASEPAGGGKSSRKPRRTHMPKPKCSQCGEPFNPAKLHSHMRSCPGLKRTGK